MIVVTSISSKAVLSRLKLIFDSLPSEQCTIIDYVHVGIGEIKITIHLKACVGEPIL